MPKSLASFESEALERAITMQDLDQLTAAELDSVSVEAGIRLQEVKVVIRLKAAELNKNHSPELARQIQQYGIERGRLAMLLQQCQVKASRVRKAEDQARIKAERKQVVRHPSIRRTAEQEVAAHFQAAAKQALDAATFQRILLMAEQRRAADFARQNGLSYHPSDSFAEIG
jgi:hypothetical protein